MIWLLRQPTLTTWGHQDTQRDLTIFPFVHPTDSDVISEAHFATSLERSCS